MKCVTYKIVNKINQKCYIGWTNKNPISKRLKSHIDSAKRGSNVLLHNAMRKYGFNNFDIYTINEFHLKENALKNEIKLIAKNKTNHCRYPGIGYNLTDGGEGTTGFTKTTKQLIAASHVITERNHKLKNRTYKEIYGERAGEEKLKRANSNIGKFVNNQTRKLQAKIKQGNKNGCFPVKITFKNGDIVIYSSRDEALKALNIKSRTTLRSIATGLRYKNGKYEKYKSPYDFTVELLRTKI